MLPPRRALELLARDPRGATGHLLMIAHRFEMKMLAGLVHEGLAEAKVGGRGRPVLDHGRGAEGDRRPLEHFSIRLGVARVCEISLAFVFGNLFEKRGDCSPKFLNSSRLHFA